MLVGNQEQKEKAYEEAAGYYRKAYETAGNDHTVYALTNLLEIESILALQGRKWKGEVRIAGTDYPYASSNDVVRILEKIIETTGIRDGDLNFWDMVEKANLMLCVLIADPSAVQDSKTVDDILAAYRRIWHLAGSKAKKMTELEHLEWLIDAVATSKKRNAQTLRKTLEQLRDELERLI
jgi:hypothetical protein